MKKDTKKIFITIALALLLGGVGIFIYRFTPILAEGKYLVFSGFTRTLDGNSNETCSQILYRLDANDPSDAKAFYSREGGRCAEFSVVENAIVGREDADLYAVTLAGKRRAFNDSFTGIHFESEFVDDSLDGELLLTILDGEGNELAKKFIPRNLVAKPSYIAPFAISDDGEDVYLTTFNEASYYNAAALWVYHWRTDALKEITMVREEKIEIADLDLAAKKALGISSRKIVDPESPGYISAAPSSMYVIDLVSGDVQALLESRDAVFSGLHLSPSGERLIWSRTDIDISYYQDIGAREAIDSFSGEFVSWIDESSILIRRGDDFFVRTLLNGAEHQAALPLPESYISEYVGWVIVE